MMIEEAGGKVTMLRGSPFDLYGKEIVVSNGLIHDEMIAVLAKGKLPEEGERRSDLL